MNIQGILEPQVKKPLAKAWGVQLKPGQDAVKIVICTFGNYLIILVLWKNERVKDNNHLSDKTVCREAGGHRCGREGGRESFRQ